MRFQRGKAMANELHKSNFSLYSNLRGVLVKTTAVDYPNRIASSFFLPGCNLLCPYCQNAALVTGKGLEKEHLCTIEELFAHLEKRKGVIGALVLTGGEPLLHDEIHKIIARAKSLGLLVKLDTNGTLPDKLNSLMQDAAPDFIAMDIKTSPERYAELENKQKIKTPPQLLSTIKANSKQASLNKQNDISAFEENYQSLLEKSISIISKLPADCREWRTVLVPGLVEEKDIDEMAKMLPKDASWQFAQFRPGGCIKSCYDNLTPMTDEKAFSLVSRALKKIPGSAMR